MDQNDEIRKLPYLLGGLERAELDKRLDPTLPDHHDPEHVAARVADRVQHVAGDGVERVLHCEEQDFVDRESLVGLGSPESAIARVVPGMCE